jgi:PadR family transcriptional regulator, regulatory protein PadR
MNIAFAQLLRGTLHVLILNCLSAGPLHGYAIATRLARRSDGVFDIEDGALYQALHRMEARDWVQSEWGHADNGKRARFYRLTEAGRRQLKLETRSWTQYAEAVFKVLDSAHA